MKKKKIKIHWGRLAVLIGTLVLMVAAVVFLFKGCCALIDYLTADERSEEVSKDNKATPQMLRCDSLMANSIDSLFNIPQRLDTASIAVAVYDVTSRREVYSRHANDTLAPASCMKVLTALAALKHLGMNHRYYESLQIKGTMVGDTLKGNLLLRADADPLLESFDGLVKQLRRTGIRHINGNIYLHLAKADTLRPHPTAKTWDIPYHKLPPLLKGKRYIERTLLYTLHANGITYHKNKKVNVKGSYRVVAQSSNALRDVITPMIIHSSNIKADAVFHHLNWKAGLARDGRTHWDGPHYSQRWVKDTFREDSAEVKKYVINDGSGLSPYNRLSASFLVKLLRYAYDDKAIRDYFINEAFATPGNGDRRGSLLTRLSKREYVDRIFVKTGTLTTIGTSSLCGYVKSNDGQWYIFSIINTDSPVAESRIFQDKLCKVLLR